MNDTRNWQREQYGEAANRLAALDKFNTEQTDWYTKCPQCNKPLRGTLAQIKEHECG